MQASKLSHVIIRTLADFGRLEEQWDTLLLASRNPSFFLSWSWVETWLEVYWRDNLELFVICFSVNDELVGVAPFVLYPRSHRVFGSYKALHFLGTGEADADSVVTEYCDLLCIEGFESEFADRLRKVLAANRGSWDLACFSDVLDDSFIKSCLMQFSDSSGFKVCEDTVGFRYCVSLPEEQDSQGCWEQYLGVLSPSFRKKVLYKRRKAARAGELEYRLVTDQASLDQAESFLKSLHSQRWREKGAEGVFVSELFSDFHHRLLRKLLVSGFLRMRVTLLDQTVIAVLYNIRFAGVESYYQSGISMSVGSKLSPGMLSHAAAIEDGINTSAHSYDFMRGAAHSYKADFGAEKQKMHYLWVYNASTAGRLLKFERSVRGLARRCKTIARRLLAKVHTN